MKPLRAALLSHELASGGTFFFLLDQTCSSRQGDKTPNTFSTGNRTRRPCKSRRYQKKKSACKRCHAFVCGLLLTPSGHRLPYRRHYYTRAYCQKKGYTHHTQAELAADLIRDLELPDTAKVVILGDTAYEAKSVQQACAKRGWQWITPCNTERRAGRPQATSEGPCFARRGFAATVCRRQGPSRHRPVRPATALVGVGAGST